MARAGTLVGRQRTPRFSALWEIVKSPDQERSRAMDQIPRTDRTPPRRLPHRGVRDRALIHAILDEALICHVGFVVDGQPFVIPTIHARVGDVLYLHGSPAGRMLRTLRDGVEVCVTATLLDGIVLARSVYNHSMNYRSAVVLGRAREVVDAD